MGMVVLFAVSHVLDHLPREDRPLAISECRRVAAVVYISKSPSKSGIWLPGKLVPMLQ